MAKTTLPSPGRPARRRKGNNLNTSALFSTCRLYRYTLHRIWNEKKPYVAFVGLNPSTADERKNDPTVARCVRYASDWKYGGMVMLNIFAYRSTNPAALYKLDEPVGAENDRHIIDLARNAGLVLTAWGNHGAHKGRGVEALKLLLDATQGRVHHLGLTGDGHPRHPLYLKATEKPRLWTEAEWLAYGIQMGG